MYVTFPVVVFVISVLMTMMLSVTVVFAVMFAMLFAISNVFCSAVAKYSSFSGYIAMIV